MTNHKHPENSYEQSNPTKRAERVKSSGAEGSKKLNPSSRQAAIKAGESVVKHRLHSAEVDE